MHRPRSSRRLPLVVLSLLAASACSYTSRRGAAGRAGGDPVVDALQRRRHPRVHVPRRGEPEGHPAGGDPSPRAGRGHRHRGRALLPPQRGGRPGPPASREGGCRGGLRRAGRVDDHPAVREAGDPRRQLADDEAQARGRVDGGAARAEAQQGPHPRAVPERHLLRERRLRDRGRGPPVLREDHPGARPRGGRAPRRAHPASARPPTRTSSPRPPPPGATWSWAGCRPTPSPRRPTSTPPRPASCSWRRPRSPPRCSTPPRTSSRT